MEKKERNIMIASIVALVLVLGAVTYAYFSARIVGVESASTISLTAGRMAIEYDDGSNNVNIQGIYPRAALWATKTITLTAYNSTNQNMEYELGFNITSNTFKGGELTFDLTGVGSNGTKIANITGKSITKTSGFFKIGEGVFGQSNGATHVYTLTFYFKDTGYDQNYNQDAVFNAKVLVRDVADSTVGKHCYSSNYVSGQTPTNGAEYVNGQYTYKYNSYITVTSGINWTADNSQNGWGVTITDRSASTAVTTELCAYVDDMPVTNMGYMFFQSEATSIDLSSFDTSNVTNMEFMFAGNKATSLDLSSFDTSNVIYMSYMFSNSRATSINLSSFNTSNVTSMYTMFGGSRATSLDLRTFNTSNVTNMSYMFSNSSTLTTIYVSNSFVTSAITGNGGDYMFNTSPNLVGGAGTTYNSSYVGQSYAHIDGGQSNPGYFTKYSI